MQKGLEFEYEILDRPTFSHLKILLKKGQEIKTEGGSMFYFDPTLEIQTKKADKGFFKSLKRTLAGETFFLNYFVANDDGYLGLAPTFTGDLMHIPLQSGDSWILFSGAYLASSINLKQETHFQGFKRGLLGGENMFFLSISAEQPGDLFIGANGSFIEIELQPGQIFNCDNGHLVAITGGVVFDIKRVGNWKATLLSGEGLITQLSNPNPTPQRVILQTRNPKEFARWIAKMIPQNHSA